MKSNNFMVVINQVLVLLCKVWSSLAFQIVVYSQFGTYFFPPGLARASSCSVEELY